MKVFISWSGDRSKKMAEALGDWLPDVIQAVVPWISTQDIPQGSRPLPAIAGELEGTDFGIACITAENRESAWVNFEAGALSKSLKGSGVVPLLLGIDKSQVAGPLSQFQMTVSTDRAEMHKLVRDINERLGDSSIASDRLDRAFGKNWEQLQSALESIGSESGNEDRPPPRSPDDLLSEILLLIRKQDRRFGELESSIADLQSSTTFTPNRRRRSSSNADIERFDSVAGRAVNEATRAVNEVVKEKSFAAFGPMAIQQLNISPTTVEIRIDPSVEIDLDELRSAAHQLSNSIGRSVHVFREDELLIAHRGY